MASENACTRRVSVTRALAGLALVLVAPGAARGEPPQDPGARASYSLGHQIGMDLARQGRAVDVESLRRGLRAGLAGGAPALPDAERDALSSLMRSLTRRFDALFATPFPYSMGWYQRPRDGGSYRGSRLHAVHLPPLVRSASVRKFLVGYELTAEPQRDLTAEEACARLKASSAG